MNQATTAAAKEVGARLLDMNKIMDSWKNNAFANYGRLKVMMSDGIHPNLWGQSRIAGEIMKAVGARPFLRSVEHLWSVLEPNYVELGYGATSWSKDRAHLLLKAMLMR
jgi:hypothetical protein